MTKPMKKFMTITESSALRMITPLLEEAGFKNYTIIDSVMGRGDRGYRHGDNMHGTGDNVLFICICDAAESQNLANLVTPYVERFGGILWQEDVEQF